MLFLFFYTRRPRRPLLALLGRGLNKVKNGEQNYGSGNKGTHGPERHYARFEFRIVALLL